MWKKSRLRDLVHILTVGDKILILCLLSLSVVSGVVLKRAHKEAKYCIISVNGKDAYKLLLSEPQKIEVKGALGESIIEIKDKSVRMLDSSCLLKICVHQGEIKSPGETIICVPNRVMIRIAGPAFGGIDAVTR
ncbi:NusG domain II-containing protein [candidate division WOR-3 bacterium]|nr:NusG domain II-containing protein [candidate division WOR-3 bacterium]